MLGMARALPAVAGELLEPCGFSPVVAGNAGALLAGCGIAGNVVVGPLMQRTKRWAACPSEEAKLAPGTEVHRPGPG